jgi:hypothetical protein
MAEHEHEQGDGPLVVDVDERVAEMQRAHAANTISAEEHLLAAQQGRLIGGAPETASVGEPSGKVAVEIAAQSPQHAKRLTDEQKLDALTWLLADADEDEQVTQTWEFNVGTEERPLWVNWTIKPLDADTMNALRQQARSEAGVNRRARRAGQGEADFDVTVFNLRMVAAATLDPDLAAAARTKGIEAADPLYGPVQMLQARTRNKPGLVDQIAGKVMLLSGYDEQDVRKATPETAMVRAAGNS